MPKSLRHIYIAVMLTVFASSAFGAGAAITYQGRIIQPDGSALNAGNVQFRIQIRTPDASNCLMYEEDRTVPMAGSNGLFALSINGAGATRTDAGLYDFNRVFANKGTFTFPAGDCGTSNTYTPSSSSGRRVTAMFYANGAWEALPSMAVNFVPYAVESTTVGGYGSGDLLRVDHASSEVVAPFTFTDYGKLVDLISGKLNGSVLPSLGSGQVLGSDGSGNWTAVTPLTLAGLPACATGEYLRVSSGALVCQTVAMTGGTVTSITAGTGLTGGTITSSGTIALATVGSGGTGAKVTYDTYGRVTSTAALAESDIPTLSTAGKVNGSAISGTIGNGTAISTSGAIQTSTDLMAGRFYLYDGGGSNTIGFRAPATVIPYVLTYPSAQGTSGQTLVNDGTGQLTWTTPLASVSGLSPLATGKIWVGDAGGKAQEVTVSGDGTLAASGALTLNTVSVAKGGTGLTTAPANGQLLIGNGAGYALGTITGGSGVNIANSAGGITITATGSGGTVTNVTGTAPIAVATGTSTPVVSIAKATTSVDGYLAATDFTVFNNKLGTATTFAGDVSGTSSTISVDKIKGSPLAITSPSSGQYLKYNGTNWINAVIDAADIGTGTFSAARMPAYTGDVSSAAGSTTLTLSTVTPAKGGTGLTSIGTANQILGVNTGATGLEYKTLTAGTGVTITPAAGTLTINATGSGGTVTNVISANADIAVASSTSTPVLTLNSGTGANQIVKLDGTSKIPAIDGSQLTGLSTSQLSAGTLPIARGGTNSATTLNNNRLMASSAGSIVELGALVDGQIVVGKTSSAPQIVNLSGDAAISNTGVLTLNTVAVAKGGTGLATLPTNGQLLIGNGTGYALGTITGGSGVNIANSAGGITITATGSGGTVTNVTGIAPIAVATGTSTPVVSIAKATSSVDGYLAATDFTIFNNKLGTATTFAGDVSGTSSTMSVDRIKGSPLAITAPASGNYLKYNGTNWINAVIDAADIGTGTLSAARMPAHTGDVTSVAGSVALTLATVTPAKGGTGLTSIGTANQILGVNTGATGLEYKTLTAGSGVTITPAAGTLTINATGSGGTVTNVTSANADIAIATGTSTPVLTLNSGTSANQIVKLDGTAKIPALDGSQLTGLSTSQLSTGTLPIARGGTNSATTLNNNRLMASSAGSIVELAALVDGQIVVGKTSSAPQIVNLSGDATISNTGALTLNTVPVAKGGTGLTTVPTNGQLLIGNGTGYTVASLTAGAGVSVTPSAGGITIAATGSGGTVTNVTGTAPIAVATGSSTPVVSIAKSTTAVDGYLAATDFTIFNNKLGTTTSFAGDVSGTSSTMSVDKIKGSPLAITAPASGNYLKYNGTNWINAVIDAADIGTGTLNAARMPAHTGDVTSVAGSVALTLATVTPAKGGTGLTSIGTANQILGVNTGATGLEYKTLTAGTGVTITPAAGTLTINATGSGGTVTNVTSANTDIAVATGTSTAVLTLNSGTSANQIVKLDGTSKIPAVDGSQLTNLSASQLTAGTLPIARGGTNSSTTLNNNRLMASSAGSIVELGALVDGQIVVGKTASAPQIVNLSGDATISNTGALTLNTVPVAKGGTGLTTVPTNGQLLIGNGTGYTVASLTAGAGVSVTPSAGGITIAATGSGGTVTNVTGTAPIAVATGTSTPVVSIAKSTTAVDGYLAATDFTIFNNKLGTATTFAGDVSGTSSTMSVDKIKGSPLAITALASGNYLKYNGTNWINTVIDAADIGTGTINAARMPAHTGDVTSVAGSVALTLATVTPAKGGTGLTSIGTANQILGVNTGATGLEYKTLTAGTGVTITPAAGMLTINATGSGGTVTNVTSANADIAVATGTSTPVLTLNSGTGASQIVKLDAGAKIPAVDGSQLTNLSTTQLSAGTLPIARGGTNSATTLNNNRLMASSAGSIVELGALVDGQIVVGKTASAPQVVNLSGDATISNTGALTLNTVAVAKGGTGLTTVPTNGQLLIGNGTGYTVASLTAGAGVSVTPSAGGITIAATGSGGTVTNVTGTAPIAVATGTSTPVVSIAKATTSVDGYLAATDFTTFNNKLGTASAFAGDVSGTSSTMSVDKIKGSPLAITALATGNYLKYNGTNWINAVIDAADIGTGTINAARMPAHTGDVTSVAGSVALTLATVTPAKGGTGLTSIGTANQILGVNIGATGLEYKTLTAGTGVTITPAAGTLTINATGSGGTVTNVTGTAPIVVATGTSTPAVSIAKATTAVDGYLAAADFTTFNNKLGTATAFAGDVSGTSSAMSVDKIKGSPLAITAPASGNYLKYNGTNWINAVIDAADIGTGTINAARMPAHTGDVTSVAGSVALTLATVTPAKGGTGLTSIGTANQILGVNTGATGLEYKTLTAGTGVTITPAAGTLTINATGSGGTVTSVNSANADIAVTTSTSAPVLTLNSGTGASQILKLNASSQIPAVDASLLTNLNPANLQSPVSVAKGGTGVATLAAHGVLLGQGTSAVTSSVGGAGTIHQGMGASVDPVWTASPVFGINASTLGTIGLANSAAGGTTTTIKPSSLNTTAYNFTLPASGGTNGYILQTDGTGVTTWVPQAGSGTVTSGTVNQLAYFTGTGTTVGGLTSTNSSVLLTNGSGVPAWSTIATDNFVQYALLAGRAGGQVLKGGSAASENLTLDSTASATKGYILMAPTGGNVGIGTATPTSLLHLNSSTSLQGLSLTNGTYSVATLQGTTGSNDNGTLTLKSGGLNGAYITAIGNSYLAGGALAVGHSSPAKMLDVRTGTGPAAWFVSQDAANTVVAPMQAIRLRSDATAPGAGFGGGVDFFLEGFTDGQITTAGAVRNYWENAQTDDTTSRNSSLVLNTMKAGIGITALTATSAGNVGIGTTTPRAAIDINGAALLKPAISNAGSTIDFLLGNLQYTANSCGTFNFNNLKDGGSYMFSVQGATSATCAFNAYSDAGSTALTVHMPPGHGASTAGKHTIYNMVVMGTHLYVSWIPGY